jgi:hypothetical protein
VAGVSESEGQPWSVSQKILSANPYDTDKPTPHETSWAVERILYVEGVSGLMRAAHEVARTNLAKAKVVT